MTPDNQSITIDQPAVSKPAAAPRPLPEFPESVLRPRRMRWRRRGRALVIVVVAGAVVAGGVLVAKRVTADADTTLRTATAGTETVDERYQGVATIEPVTRAQVAFPVSGTVNSVGVEVGDTVEIGQTLATVDTTALQQSLNQAMSTLTSAQLTLNVALSGEDPSASGAGGLGSSSGGSGPAVGVSTSGDVVFDFAPANIDAYTYVLTGTSDDVAAARQAVVAAQSNVNSATNTAAAKRDAAVSICAAVNVTIDPNDPQGSIGTISSSLGACQSALNDLMAAQNSVTSAQSQLNDAVDALDNLLGQWQDELDSSTPTTTTAPTTTTPETPATTVPTTDQPPTSEPRTPSGSTPPSGTTPDNGSTPDGGGSFSGAPTGNGGGGSFNGAAPSGGSSTAADVREPTSQELIAYQDAYDAAMHSVEAAQQAIEQATIVSPIGGTVISVDIAAGDSVSAASDTQTIVVEGDGGYEATLSVSVDDIDRIDVDQPAQLVPDGGGPAVAGNVVAISQVPDSSGSTANYRVTVGLSGDTSQLRNGNVGDVAIVVDSGDDVIAVPTSAVTTTANGHTVDVVDPVTGEVSTVRVRIGAVGPQWTEITQGIDAGQTVVIADVDEPLPGSATDSSNANTTGNGGQIFPQGGFFPGGGNFTRQFGG